MIEEGTMHEVYFVNGEAQMFSVRETPWHGLGHVPQDYPGREKAIELAGHDFKVIERPIAVVGKLREDNVPGNPGAVPYIVGDDGVHGIKKAEGWKALIHSVSGDVLNVTSESYGVVQNDTLWDIVDVLVDQPDVQYETAGVLRGGAVLWVLARAGKPTWITGDNSPILQYFLCQTTHDGSGACKASNVDMRVVCMNTKGAADAESQASGREFIFRHTKNVMSRIEDAKKALSCAAKQHQAFVELAEDLAHVPLTPEQRDDFLSRFIPMPEAKTGAIITDRVARNVEDARGAVLAILNGPTTAEAHRFTAYGAWQAGIEYLDHVRKAKSKDTYFTRSMIRQEPAKYNLAKLVREVAQV